jgi:hypothetical protein
VSDDFADRYEGLLAGSYDWVDRVVLNAYFPLGHNPGGFRCWWRLLHGGSDDHLDDTHLMRMAGRFARRATGEGGVRELEPQVNKGGMTRSVNGRSWSGPTPTARLRSCPRR